MAPSTEVSSNRTTNRKSNSTRSRFSGALIAALVAVMASTSVAAEKVALIDARQPGDLQRVQVTFEVIGSLGIGAEAKDEKGENPLEVKMSAAARLAYQERMVTHSGANSVAGRYYEGAVAKLQVGELKEDVQLDETQRLVIAESLNGQGLTSAGQPLSRKEKEMIAVPGNGLVAYRLLPGKTVSVGETWSHQSEDLAAILNIDEVIVNEVRTRLVSLDNGLARMQIAGSLTGNINGAATEIKLSGDCRYDTGWKRINWLQLTIEENRDPSAAQPGFNVRAEMRMLAAPHKDSPELESGKLAKTIQQLDRRKSFLRFESEPGAFRLIHDETWHLVDDREINTSMRLVQRGKQIAQCNIRRLKRLEKGKTLGLDEFQSDIQKALGKRFGEFAKAKKNQRADGYEVLHVVAQGAVSELPIRWVYYHLTSPEGERVSYVFTMENRMTDNFAAADHAMVDSIQLMARANVEGKSGEESTANLRSPAARR